MTEILICCGVVMLILLVEHYFPWRLILGRKLPRLAAYVLGVLAMVGPLSFLYFRWEVAPVMVHGHLVALWCVVVSGGLAVLLAYALDWIAGRVRLSYELAELAEFDATRQTD